MNRFAFASAFAILLILVLLVNLTWVQAFREDQYANNPLNQRGFYEMKSIPRGQIATGGMVLASSSQDGDGFYQRSYPSDDPAAFVPVTGYLSDQYGASGLEASYNQVLNGTDPGLFTSRWMDTLTGKETAGANLELTLDPQMQQVHQQLTGNGYRRGRRWSVRARWPLPGYDPNAPSTLPLRRRRGSRHRPGQPVNHAAGHPAGGVDLQDHHHRGGPDQRLLRRLAAHRRPGDHPPRHHDDADELRRPGVRRRR